MEEKMMKKIICRSCASEFDASLVRCPFCGTAYAPAEEDEYMDKLEDIREDLHMEVKRGDTKIKKKVGSAVGAIILVIIVLLFLIFGLFMFSTKHERDNSDRKKEEFLQNQGITTQQEENDQ